MNEVRALNEATTGASTETCAEFQDRLAQLFESQTGLEREAHLQSCERCAELVRDLKYIADQAKLLLPIHDPGPHVWDKIQRELVSGDMQRETANSEGSR